MLKMAVDSGCARQAPSPGDLTSRHSFRNLETPARRVREGIVAAHISWSLSCASGWQWKFPGLADEGFWIQKRRVVSRVVGGSDLRPPPASVQVIGWEWITSSPGFERIPP